MVKKDNIKLVINGKKRDLINKCNLRKGDNIIRMKIENEIRDLKEMFYACDKLKNIDELKYLKTKYCFNF